MISVGQKQLCPYSFHCYFDMQCIIPYIRQKNIKKTTNMARTLTTNYDLQQ